MLTGHPKRILLFALLCGVALTSIASAVFAGARSDATQQLSTLNRDGDPVVAPGSALPDFQGTAVGQMRLYAFDGASWNPIRFQIDERTNDADELYVALEDGTYDANDELVFMAQDAGLQASPQNWPADMMAQQATRLEITVSDPLDSLGVGYVYLFNSTTLPLSSQPNYVFWNGTTQVVTADRYIATYGAGASPTPFFGLADLEINGNGVDILDRLKVRASGAILTINEDSLAVFIPPSISIQVVGPVRGIKNDGLLQLAVYGSRLDVAAVLDTASLPISVNDMRISLDMNDPAVTGINEYYDSHGDAFTIDGLPDTLASTAPVDWFQVAGPSGGVSVVVPQVAAGPTAVLETYYCDDVSNPGSDCDGTNDTGDQISFGDTGVAINSPSGTIEFELITYILEPNAGNVGATFDARARNPLQTTATPQDFSMPIFMPLIRNN